jgi:hypothetical protein
LQGAWKRHNEALAERGDALEAERLENLGRGLRTGEVAESIYGAPFEELSANEALREEDTREHERLPGEPP